MDRAAVRKHYLEGWFLIDFVATVQWELVWALVSDAEVTSLIQLARLFKVLRMARASRLIMRLTATWTINTTYIRVSVFMLYVGMICHLLACAFFMLPDIVECPQDASAMPLTIPPGEFSELQASWRVNEPGGPSADEVAALADGIGWYKQGACLQGSWRQEYGLEAICEVLDARACIAQRQRGTMTR